MHRKADCTCLPLANLWAYHTTSKRDLIRSEGDKSSAAWQGTLGPVRAFGMLPGWRISESGPG